MPYYTQRVDPQPRGNEILPLPEEFRVRLAETGMVYHDPSGFYRVAPIPNGSFKYHHAVAASMPKLEIRYQIVRPEGQDSFVHSSLGDSASARVAMLMSVIANLAAKVLSAPSPFPEAAARQEFGADWGAVCRLALISSAFSKGFQECMLVALHRGAAAAYIALLFDDFAKAAPAIEANFYTLRFSEPRLS